MTQHQKIIEMCSDGKYHCQIEFWDLFIRSPHKRRGEIEKRGEYEFKTRPCEHKVKNGYDYLMFRKQRVASEVVTPRMLEIIKQRIQPRLL